MAASCVLSAITFDVEIEAQTECAALVIPAGLLAAMSRENVYMDNFMYKEAAKRFFRCGGGFAADDFFKSDPESGFFSVR